MTAEAQRHRHHGREHGPGHPSGAGRSGPAPARAIRLRPRWLIHAGNGRRSVKVIQRDIDMLRFLIEGGDQAQLARAQGVTEAAVTYRLRALRERAGARSTYQLVYMATVAGLFENPATDGAGAAT